MASQEEVVAEEVVVASMLLVAVVAGLALCLEVFKSHTDWITERPS